MIFILTLIIVPLAANYIAEWSGVMENFKLFLYYKVYTRKTEYNSYRLKPFDCSLCLSFHLCYICEIATAQSLSITTLLLPFASGGVAYLLSKLFNH